MSTTITSIRLKFRCSKVGAEIVLHNATLTDCPFCHRTIGNKKWQCDMTRTILITEFISRSPAYDQFKKRRTFQPRAPRKINLDDFAGEEL